MRKRPLRFKTDLRILADEARLEISIAKYKLADPELKKSLFKFLAVVAGIFFLSNIVSYFYTNADALLGFIESAKGFGPLIIILLIVLEVILAPLPGFVITVSAGYLYGSLLGAFYSYLGNVLGSIMAFLLAQKFGRPFVEKVVSHGLLIRYDKFFSKSRHYLMLLYMIPVVPVDILSFIAGFSSLKFRRFLLVVGVGFIPNVLILAFFGEYLTEAGFFTTILYVVLFLLVFGGLSLLFKRIISRFD